MNIRRLLPILVLVSAVAGCAGSGSQSTAPDVLSAQSSTSALCHRPCVVAEYPLAKFSQPDDITAGPDGNVWFTELSERIGKITPSGVITEYCCTRGGPALGIVTGPDGNLWFTEYCNACSSPPAIGKITTSGVITEYHVKPPINRGLNDITVGQDGNLWFTDKILDSGGNLIESRIGKITTRGVISEFTIRRQASPSSIVAGPDGNLWFTEGITSNKIGKITMQGALTEISIPGAGRQSWDITVGPHHGNLWFSQADHNFFDRITVGGVITEYKTHVGAVLGIATGPDGNIWFTDPDVNRIVRSTVLGQVSEYKIPTPNSGAQNITAGPDGNLWFTELKRDKIGKLAP